VECVRRNPWFSTGWGSVVARNALLNMIDHLQTRSLSRQQAYALSSVAVDLRISQTMDVPNLLVSALLPLDIFV
jgi:formamidase